MVESVADSWIFFNVPIVKQINYFIYFSTFSSLLFCLAFSAAFYPDIFHVLFRDALSRRISFPRLYISESKIHARQAVPAMYENYVFDIQTFSQAASLILDLKEILFSCIDFPFPEWWNDFIVG